MLSQTDNARTKTEIKKKDQTDNKVISNAPSAHNSSYNQWLVDV
ncbi:MAG: hypothetical protein OEY51_06875 [Cyclobacteriaceae bacterium]|nr:hypothetical protein [Cyclobacteriaceae bacterium]